MSQYQKQLSSSSIQLLGILILLLLSACQAGTPGDGPAGSAAATAEPALPDPTNTAPAPEPSAETPTETPTEPPDLQVFQIVAEKSETRFYIDEVLFGNQKTVVGRTRDLSGEILLDMEIPSATEVGLIEINALDLTTDDSFRNRALRSQILESNKDEFQYILFAPLAIEGLPETVTFGEPLELLLTGELTIRGVTSPVTFELIVTPVSAGELSGSGSAIVLRETFGLEIPKVTGVAEVSQEVRLEIDFVALAN